MYIVYVLNNAKTNRYYIGQTNNLKRRLKEHNFKSSWQIVYIEGYLTRALAIRRERTLKNYGTTWTRLKQRLNFER